MSEKRIKPVLRQLAGKGMWYWVRVAAIGVFGFWLNTWLSRNPPVWLQDLRMEVFQDVSNLSTRSQSGVNITLVMIGDNAYWKGPLARRTPVKRDYLAALVTRLCAADPQVVALDFDLHSPVVDGSFNDNPEYKAETLTLVNSVNKAARSGCKIVLPVMMNCGDDGRCTREANVLDGYPFTSPNITWGYINLPKDVRQIPLRLPYAASGQLDSFMQAIVRAVDERKANALPTKGPLPYSTFMPVKEYLSDLPPVSSSDALTLSREALEPKIRFHIVVVGAGWHQVAYGQGAYIDEHHSPLGPVSGPYLHVNYAAAVLDNRIRPGVGEWFGTVVDILVIVVVAVIFAINLPSHKRLLSIVAMAVVIAALQYLAWQNLGYFFDCTIPVLVLFAHWLYDEHEHMRERLKELEAVHRQQNSPTRTPKGD